VEREIRAERKKESGLWGGKDRRKVRLKTGMVVLGTTNKGKAGGKEKKESAQTQNAQRVSIIPRQIKDGAQQFLV